MAGVVIVTRGTDEDQAEGNRDLEIATCPANCPETPQPLQSRFLNRGSFPKLAHFPRAFSTHGLGLGSSWGYTPMLLLHLAYSEEDLKFKAQCRVDRVDRVECRERA